MDFDILIDCPGASPGEIADAHAVFTSVLVAGLDDLAERAFYAQRKAKEQGRESLTPDERFLDGVWIVAFGCAVMSARAEVLPAEIKGVAVTPATAI
ncbi:hypothetical protein [Variovorax paradoxus]|uniref:hypothetical protein n=1 Tax=Variovorax paradoxus TaxID=34073 RepID=UPI003D64D049